MRKRKNKYIPPKTASSEKNDQFSFKKLIAILLVVNLLTTGVSFAYCIETGSSYDAARVAKFHVQLTPPTENEVVIVAGSSNTTAEYVVDVTNYSEVAVACSAKLTIGRDTENLRNKLNVKGQFGDNAAVAASASGMTYTFNNLGTIKPNDITDFKVIFELKGTYNDDFNNHFMTGLKLVMTLDQVD